VRLTVVGCSGSFPGPDSAASSYLVEAPDPVDPDRTWRLLLDLGSGALGPLQRLTDPLALDAVLISHLHPDHFFDMSGYYVLRRYHPRGPQPVIRVHGPRGIQRRLSKAYGLPKDPGMNEEFEFHELVGRPLAVGPFRVTTALMDHPVEAHAMRVEHAERALVYSADTGPNDALVELARGADLLLCEAAFRDGEENPSGVHMTGSDAGAAAKAAGVARLVVTHVPPWHSRETARTEAQTVFDGPVDVAVEGATFDL
jgi:ribonuclease BN (tRNA processing enzyme)